MSSISGLQSEKSSTKRSSQLQIGRQIVQDGTNGRGVLSLVSSMVKLFVGQEFLVVI